MSQTIAGIRYNLSADFSSEPWAYKEDKFSYTIIAGSDPHIVELHLSFNKDKGFARVTTNESYVQEFEPEDITDLLKQVKEEGAGNLHRQKGQDLFKVTLTGRFLDVKAGDKPEYQRIPANRYTCRYVFNGESDIYTMIVDKEHVIVTSDSTGVVERFPLERVAQRLTNAGNQVSELKNSRGPALKIIRKGPLLFYLDTNNKLPWER